MPVLTNNAKTSILSKILAWLFTGNKVPVGRELPILFRGRLVPPLKILETLLEQTLVSISLTTKGLIKLVTFIEQKSMLVQKSLFLTLILCTVNPWKIKRTTILFTKGSNRVKKSSSLTKFTTTKKNGLTILTNKIQTSITKQIKTTLPISLDRVTKILTECKITPWLNNDLKKKLLKTISKKGFWKLKDIEKN